MVMMKKGDQKTDSGGRVQEKFVAESTLLICTSIVCETLVIQVRFLLQWQHEKKYGRGYENIRPKQVVDTLPDITCYWVSYCLPS